MRNRTKVYREGKQVDTLTVRRNAGRRDQYGGIERRNRRRSLRRWRCSGRNVGRAGHSEAGRAVMAKQRVPPGDHGCLVARPGDIKPPLAHSPQPTPRADPWPPSPFVPVSLSPP